MRIANSEGTVITVPNPGPGRSVANEIRTVYNFAAVTVAGGKAVGEDTPYNVRGVVTPMLEGPITRGELVRFDADGETIGQGADHDGQVFGRALDEVEPGDVAPCRVWMINGMLPSEITPADESAS